MCVCVCMCLKRQKKASSSMQNHDSLRVHTSKEEKKIRLEKETDFDNRPNLHNFKTASSEGEKTRILFPFVFPNPVSKPAFRRRKKRGEERKRERERQREARERRRNITQAREREGATTGRPDTASASSSINTNEVNWSGNC